jgi:transposase
MRRPVYDRILVDSFDQCNALEVQERRPALKKLITSTMARPKKTRQNKASKPSGKLTVGIDLGDQNSAYCILDAEGEVLSEGTVRTSEHGFAQQFERMGICRIALETGTHSPWVSRMLQKYGHDVVVANARHVRLICDSDRKNDRVDARTLARLARIDKDLLHPIRHRSEKAQADLAMLRARDALVQVRTKLINCARGMVKSVGGRLPAASGECFAKRVRDQIPEGIRDALLPLMDQIENVSKELREYDKQIEKMAKTQYDQTQLMRQIPGVGVITSMALTLTIEDPHRFRKSRDVAAYLGLLPRQCDSGASKPQLSITKAGDPMVRRLLVGCAHYVLGRFGPDSDLRRWGLSLMAHGGKNAKKRAVVAVARKLAVLMHKLWVTGEVYEPLREANEAKPAAA